MAKKLEINWGYLTVIIFIIALLLDGIYSPVEAPEPKEKAVIVKEISDSKFKLRFEDGIVNTKVLSDGYEVGDTIYTTK